MRKRFFLYTQNRLLKLLFIINVMDLLTQMLQRTDKETASAAGKIYVPTDFDTKEKALSGANAAEKGLK